MLCWVSLIGMTFFFLKHYLFAKNSSTLVRRIAEISFGAVVLASSAFLLVLFIMNAMNLNTKKRLVSIEPHAVVTRFSDTPKETFGKNISSIAEKNGLKYQSFEKQDLVIQTNEGIFRGALGYGLDDQGLVRLQKSAKTNRTKTESIESFEGPLPPAEESGLTLKADEILVGVDLANSLGLMKGDFVNVIAPESLLASGNSPFQLERLRVVALIRTDIPEFDAQTIVYNQNQSLRSFQGSLSRKEGYEFFTAEPLAVTDWSPISSQIVGGHLVSWQEQNSALLYALKVEKLAIGFILSLAALIASLSLFTVVSLLIKNRQHDIAILRTLGLPFQSCQRLFAGIGTWLAGSALVTGVVLGTGLSLWLERHPLNILPEIFYDSALQARVDLSLVFWVLFVGFTFIIFGTWMSARSVQEVKPAELLKH